MIRTVCTAALAITATTLVASCGESPRNPLTHAELIAKTEAICRRLDTKRPSLKLGTPQDDARSLPKLVVYERTALAELNKLVPPASSASEWKQLSANIAAFTDDMARLATYLGANNITAARAQYSVVGKAQNDILNTLIRRHVTECVRVF